MRVEQGARQTLVGINGWVCFVTVTTKPSTKTLQRNQGVKKTEPLSGSRIKQDNKVVEVTGQIVGML